MESQSPARRHAERLQRPVEQPDAGSISHTNRLAAANPITYGMKNTVAEEAHTAPAAVHEQREPKPTRSGSA